METTSSKGESDQGTYYLIAVDYSFLLAMKH